MADPWYFSLILIRESAGQSLSRYLCQIQHQHHERVFPAKVLVRASRDIPVMLERFRSAGL